MEKQSTSLAKARRICTASICAFLVLAGQAVAQEPTLSTDELQSLLQKLEPSTERVSERTIPKRQTSIPSALQLRVAGLETSVRVVVDFDASVPIELFPLAEPYRYVIEMPGINFKFDDEAGRGSPGFLTSVRYGKINEDHARIILEADQPMAIKQAFIVPAANDQPERLVIDLISASEDDFQSALLAHEQKKQEREAQNKPPEPEDDEPQSVDAQKETSQKPTKKRIVIDPGHGGIDSGAVGKDNVLEKNIVLQFAKDLAKVLESNDEFDVVLTREDDRFLKLSERVEFARTEKADLFISLHADSFKDSKDVRGASVYTLSERASNAAAAALARRENKSDLVAGLDIKDADERAIDILLDLTRRETQNLSILFARHIVDDLEGKITFFKNPLQSAAFQVLKAPEIPSALIELGYLSSEKDAKLLSSKEWRAKTTKSMADSIKKYFENRLSEMQN